MRKLWVSLAVAIAANAQLIETAFAQCSPNRVLVSVVPGGAADGGPLYYCKCAPGYVDPVAAGTRAPPYGLPPCVRARTAQPASPAKQAREHIPKSRATSPATQSKPAATAKQTKPPKANEPVKRTASKPAPAQALSCARVGQQMCAADTSGTMMEFRCQQTGSQITPILTGSACPPAFGGGARPTAGGADDNNWKRAIESDPALAKFEKEVKAGPVSYERIMELAPRHRRSLKGAPADILDAVLKVENRAKQQIDQAVRETVNGVKNLNDGSDAPWVGRPLLVEEVRAPGHDPRSYNTDRDVHVLYSPDGAKWIEVPKEIWRETFHEEFAKASGYSATRVENLAKPDEIAAWSKLPEPARDIAKKKKWAEEHGQMATDKAHIEAYSEHPGTLEITFRAKVEPYLRSGDTLEAMAQLNKNIDTFLRLRASVQMTEGRVRKIDPRMQAAFEAIKSLEPFDASITRAQIAHVEKKLAELLSRSNFIVKRGVESLDYLSTLIASQIPKSAGAIPAGDATEADEISWRLIKDTTDPESLRRFINQFPQSRHHADAQSRLNKLANPTAERTSKP